MSSQVQLRGLAIKESWHTFKKRCNDHPFGERRLVDSLLELEHVYLDEVERVEINLHLKFKTVSEKLSELFGPDIKKLLLEGWSFETDRYLSACKENVLQSQDKWESQSKY